MANAIPYGLLRREDVVVGDVSPAAAAAREQAYAATQARLEAFDAERLTFEVSCAALAIARGPFDFPCGSVTWELRALDPTRAATLKLPGLPSMSVRELLKAGIITTTGVDEEAFERAVKALPR